MFRRSARNAKTSSAGWAIVTVFWKVCIAVFVSAGQQPLGGCGVVGGQHDQARLVPGESKDLAAGLGELSAVAHAGYLAALEDASSVSEVAYQQQGRPVLAADQQRHRAGRVTGGRQQHQ